MYIFAYGALLNTKTGTKPKKAWPVLVHGLKRSLNVMGAKNKVFGVKEVSHSKCNGILFKVNSDELAKLQTREKLYTLEPLKQERIAFIYEEPQPQHQHQHHPPKLNPSDQIFYFRPQAPYVLTKKEAATQPVSAKYINTCLDGAAKVSETFLQDFLTMTHGVQ
jgi:hypothetical protein